MSLKTRQGHILKNPLADDLDHILAYTEDLWEDLSGKRLFITGGTGFFGRWLLESLLWANKRLNLNASALILTRDYNTFKKNAPHLAEDPMIDFHTGDIRDFDFPKGEFSHIIHAAATSAVATFNNEDPLVKFDTVAEGTRHALDFAVQCRAEKFLLTSSGSVYGKQPSTLTHLSEDYCGRPDLLDPSSALGEGKRTAEFLSVLYSKKYGIDVKIARCFSFVGPHLPLDIHYAIGNFIKDAINGGPIRVNGDGTPYRSYLYAADLIIWLWTILIKGKSCRAYNVGSDKGISIAEVAEAVANIFDRSIAVTIARKANPNQNPERYVPAINRASSELNLKQTIELKDALRRTVNWSTR